MANVSFDCVVVDNASPVLSEIGARLERFIEELEHADVTGEDEADQGERHS